jgi:ribosomal peptide maturation radical SAM protein 1
MDDQASRAPKVALISMPTLVADMPSFQLALLEPTLRRHGIDAQTFSLYLYFGAHIGWRINDELRAVRPCLAGEWIWSRAAFGDFSDEQDYLQRFEQSIASICREAGCSPEDLLAIRREKTESFLEFCADRIDWRRFDLIGFSVVFQQMTASLALARILRERHPEIPIVLGGATFEDDIAEGIMRGCPWVDYIHCGDADRTFPELVWRLHRGQTPADVPGVMWRDGGQVRYLGRAPNLSDLSSTPTPSFDEYFYARRESGYGAWPEAKEPLLPIETARGCWWGQKHHCTFCGLNRAGMEFRSKPADQVIEMLEALACRYGTFHFDAIDNIMDPAYIEDLFGRLASSHSDFEIHYEVRPYMGREQLRELRRGGLFSVQPGIESLSTHVLELMRKKSTGVRNVSFIKWCTHYGINNLYNILWGFPGETEEDYRQQSEVIAKIPHLQPPWGIARARADRGSPMFTQPREHGIVRLTPTECYAYIYPRDRFRLEDVAYYFDHEQEILPDAAYEGLLTRVAIWQQRWHRRPRPSLKYHRAWRSLVIVDARHGAPSKLVYREREARLYELCSEPATPKALVEAFDGDEGWVRETLDAFVERDLVLHLDGRYLSLALPAKP